MTEILKTEKNTRVLNWLPLPEETLKALDLKIGDWILLKPEDKGFSIEKVNLEQITVELNTELIEMALTFRDIEGYYTLEEALSNMIRKGLAQLYRKRVNEEKAETYEDSYLVQIHSG